MGLRVRIRSALDASQAQHDAIWVSGGLLGSRRLSSVLLLLEFHIPIAAGAERDRGTMRAGAGVAEESADLIRRFGREDVFELAGLLFDF